MGISPFYVGQLLPTMTLTFTKDTGGVLDLTGATITSLLHNIETGQDTAMVGAWAVNSPATAGVATYTWAAGDTATAGNYLIYPVATFAGKPENGDPIPFLILST
jgi:hypothetical protein